MPRLELEANAFGKVDASGYAVREYQVGTHRVRILQTGDKTAFNFRVPDDFSALVGLYIVIIPDATENIQYDAAANYGAVGELYNQNNAAVVNQILAVTINLITQVDLSALVGALAAGDYVGIEFGSDIDTLFVWGLVLRYT